MHRSRATLVALTTLVVLAVAACGGAAASPISDPKEILVKSVEAAQAAKTVHVKLEVAGKVPIGDLSGLLGGLSGVPGASSAPLPSTAPGASASPAGIDLSGTTAEGDLDLAKTAAHIGFSAPSLLDLTGDLIAVDGAAYLKVSLLGDKYQKLGGTPGSTASPGASASPSPTAGMLDSLRSALDQLKTPPTKLADEQCGDTKCYHVQVTLDQSTTGGLESLAPGVTGTGTVDVWVRQNDLRPSQVVIKGDSGSAAGLTLTLTLSDWDKAVSIQAPPADQISSGGSLLPSFSIPSFALPSPSA